MSFKGKALYNLLKISHDEDPTVEVKPWQIAQYSNIDSEKLFSRLARLGITLSEQTFMAFADSFDTPEELVDCLWIEEETDERFEECYLIIFELWKRFFPKKQTLSIFGDELDQMICLYDKDALADEEELQKLISDLEDILDQAADSGTSTEEVFQMVCQFCAHDIETFLYDYIIEQMDEGNEIYASELLDGYYDYVSDKKWFDFLKARLIALSDAEDSDSLLLGLLEQQEENPDLDLCFEICRFVVNRGDTEIFFRAADLLLTLINQENEFQAFLDILAEFHRCLDLDYQEKAVLDILSNRKDIPADQAVTLKDKEMIKEYLKDS